ncbi:MAG: ABC transporter ATP-binding protein [Chitinophagales bacterium]|nr:ABC transporter ATP-binding protein [Chitinophagales bacterium]
MDPLLDVHNLSVEFSRNHANLRAVEGISFQLRQQETIGIVGESGSGKSVTALSIMRLISGPGKITSGEIYFGAESRTNLLTLPETQMQHFRGREIAMIFQEPMTSLNPVITCGNQVTEAIRLHLKLEKQQAMERALHLFEEVKLPDPHRIFRAYPHQLSGGQKQRVMIAMAMSCNPALLIADEPTTALDVTVQARILELMAELKEQHRMSMIFISHDLGVVSQIAQRVLVMYRGKIVEQGDVSKIFRQPEHPYTKGLIACRPPLNRKLKRLPVISDFMNEYGEELTTTVTATPGNKDLEVPADYIINRLNLLQSQKPLLSVRNFSVSFHNHQMSRRHAAAVNAVSDVSFDVYPGETLGLVGESGSGKTTLGRSILQLIKPSSGEVIFKERNLSSISITDLKKLRKDLQIIFQDPYSSLNPRLTIGYSIMEPMKAHGLLVNDKERKEKTIGLLRKVNLPEDSFNRYPHEFSGGQRQRICIARALAVNPAFIICDECVSSLDVSIQAQVLNLLMQLREEFNLTYIFISHDLSVVKFMSDRIAVMNQGRIEELAPADEIYEHPATTYTRKLISAIPKGEHFTHSKQ